MVNHHLGVVKAFILAEDRAESLVRFAALTRQLAR